MKTKISFWAILINWKRNTYILMKAIAKETTELIRELLKDVKNIERRVKSLF